MFEEILYKKNQLPYSSPLTNTQEWVSSYILTKNTKFYSVMFIMAYFLKSVFFAPVAVPDKKQQ